MKVNIFVFSVKWIEGYTYYTDIKANKRPSGVLCLLCSLVLLLKDLPTIVCLVRASWLLCTSNSSSRPEGSVCLSLKKSTSACGFFQSTWIETSVWPRTRISSIAETSGKDTGLGGTGCTDMMESRHSSKIKNMCPALPSHVFKLGSDFPAPRKLIFPGSGPSRNFLFGSLEIIITKWHSIISFICPLEKKITHFRGVCLIRWIILSI